MPTTSEKPTQPIEGELITADMGGRYRRRPSLTTARGIRKELAALYLEHRRGEIDNDHTRTAGFILRTLLESIRTDELEARIEQLEQEQNR
ncbi:hypothetical protein ABZN20_12130 [Methylococcus sp. ANG]|uniref:hypothetical protein n=1 Tax=Methylococcus sp. ANG TaxID=3231903 RepID=UPI00345B31BF